MNTDFTHILPVRIYYEDTDLSGVVYHANYLRFMERGRAEYLRNSGIALLSKDAEPTFWTVHKLEIEYLRPARIDDLLSVHTKIASLTGVRIKFEQTIFHGNVKLTHAVVELCMINSKGAIQRIPREIHAILIPIQELE